MSIKIVLADDHQIMREGIASLLGNLPDVEILAQADNGRDCIKLATTLFPDVVIMDISMPDLNGIEATCRILKEAPKIKIIALSMHSDRQFVIKMLKAGAIGYLLKDCSFGELVEGIRAVHGDNFFLSPRITDSVVREYVQKMVEPEPNLTSREREVLQLISEGKTTKEIAIVLNLSAKTVESHRQAIMGKLNIHSVAKLTKYAIKEGLTTL